MIRPANCTKVLDTDARVQLLHHEKFDSDNQDVKSDHTLLREDHGTNDQERNYIVRKYKSWMSPS